MAGNDRRTGTAVRSGSKRGGQSVRAMTSSRHSSLAVVVTVTATLLVVVPSAGASAGDVTTIAGTGAPGFAGDGGPALAAQLKGPAGIAVAPDSTVYFADGANYRIRRISPGGVISTVAGSGVNSEGDGDFAADGGPATGARLGGVLNVALNPAADVLYFGDISNNRVRQVDLATGVISNFAGQGPFGPGFGFSGDGGPATAAGLALPEGVATDSAGNVYITDVLNCRIRKVDGLTGIIQTIAGNGDCLTAGDGGPATAASFSLPSRLAVDGAGNVFTLDLGSPNVARRIDSATGVITTVAGGGAITPGFGTATETDLGSATELVTDEAGRVFIATRTQVFKVDLASGVLSVFAGTGVTGFSGDGGPAIAAEFADILGLGFKPTGELLVSEEFARIRSIEPSVADDAVVDLLTSQEFLDSIEDLQGSLVMINVDGRTLLIVPNMTSVGLNITVTDNDQLLVIDLQALQSVGGNVDITGNLVMTDLDLSALTTVDGSLTIAGNPELSAVLVSGVTSIGGDLSLIGTAATVINLGSLTDVVGDLVISDNDSATAIDLGSVTSVGGDLVISGNDATEVIDLGSLTSVGGDLIVDTNTSATAIDLGSLTSVGGSLSVSGNTSATVVNLGSATSVGGSVTITDNTSATTVSLGSLGTAAGSVDISGNSSAGVIDLGSLTESGSVTITDNTSATTVSLGSLGTAAGSVDISGNSSAGVIDLGSLTESGSVTITDNTSATTVSLGSLGTAAGSVDISGNSSAGVIELGSLTSVGGSLTVLANGSCPHVTVGSLTSVTGDLSVASCGEGTFETGSVSSGGDTSLTTEGYSTVSGTTATGDTTVENARVEAVMRAHIAAATFVTPVGFAITRIDPAALPPESGTGPDGGRGLIDPIAAYEFSFGVPTLNQDATLSFEVQVAGLDAATHDAFLAALEAGTATLATRGNAPGASYQAFPLCTSAQVPAADGCVLVEKLDANGQPTTGVPAVVRFTNVVGHFSTWAVAIVEPSAGNQPPTISDIADISTNEATATPAIPFTIGDAETAANDLIVSGSSSNTDLVANDGISFSGSGADRTLVVTPTAGESGSSTITVTLSDGSLSTSDTFVLTVVAPPTTTTVAPTTTTPVVPTTTTSVAPTTTTTTPGTTCFGRPATILGTARPDNLIGTSSVDVIVGLDGDDTIQGKGGDDFICAGSGDDSVEAGTGNDTVSGGDGVDTIGGGSGDDDLHGDHGNDLLYGRSGDDDLVGGNGVDACKGGAGTNTLVTCERGRRV